MEEALKYPADVIFNSTRPGTLTNEDLMAHPVFGQHPAAKAGQMGLWNQDFMMDYQGMTAALEATIGPVMGPDQSHLAGCLGWLPSFRAGEPVSSPPPTGFDADFNNLGREPGASAPGSYRRNCGGEAGSRRHPST